MNDMKKEAAFIVGFLDALGNRVAATTRLGKHYSIGLPGGKVELKETPLDAALREAFEEGWDFRHCTILPDPVHIQQVDDYVVYWFVAVEGVPLQLSDFKEKHRGILPISGERHQLVDYGNDQAIPKAWATFLEYQSKEIAESKLWNRAALSRTLHSYGIFENVTEATSERFCQLLQEAARRSSKRVLKLMRRFDVGFVTAFRGFDNLPPLAQEEPLRVEYKNLTPEQKDRFIQKVKKEHEDFDDLTEKEQEQLIELERNRQKRIIALARNRKRNKELEEKIRSAPAHYSYIPVRGAYHETLSNGKTQLAEEESFIVIDQHGVGTLRDDIIRWGIEYEQEAVIFKQADQEAEMIFTGKRGGTDRRHGDIMSKFQAILFDDPSVYLDAEKNWTQLKGKRNFYFIQTEPQPKNKDVVNPPTTSEAKKRVLERFYAEKPLNSQPYQAPNPLSEQEEVRVGISHIRKCLKNLQQLAEDFHKTQDENTYRKIRSQLKQARHAARLPCLKNHRNEIQTILLECEELVEKLEKYCH